MKKVESTHVVCEPFPDPNGISLEEYIKTKQSNAKSKFEAFPDPKGVPFYEYMKNKGESSKFAPFPDPNGVSQDQFEK